MIYTKSVLADLLTPVSTFLRLAANSDRAFLLESVEGAERIGRYSFIGLNLTRSFSGSYAEFRQTFPDFIDTPSNLPPLLGGAVGFFSYDLVREFEKLTDREKPVPDLVSGAPVRMDFYSTVLVFDHLRHEILIVSHEGSDRVDHLEHLLSRAQVNEMVRPPRGALLSTDREGGESTLGGVHSGDFTAERFEKAVHIVQQYVREGDIFQVVLSQRSEVPFDGDPFDVYRALRYLNPSPYHFFLKQGDLCIAGASPEMLVKLQGRSVEARPIAGTRRRGQDSQDDDRLAAELLADEKERAEHLMLVDLGRNDLGRVSQYGSIQLVDFMRIERYSHVMHLVSSVIGVLRPELDAFDVLACCFPAGTVSGAPKVRAMEIIDELEPWRRGVYAGAIGYLDYSGNLDTCIAIRTIVFKSGKAFIQAGAGIVADSVPRHEDMECHNKAKVLFQALEMGAGPRAANKD